MKHTFYGSKKNSLINFNQNSTLKGFDFKNNLNHNNSFKNKTNIYFDEYININKSGSNNKNPLKNNENNINNNSNKNIKKEYGYIFYGNNKFFKVKSGNFNSYNICDNNKRKKLLNKLNDNYNSKIKIFKEYQLKDNYQAI